MYVSQLKPRAVTAQNSLEDGVGVQVDTHHVSGRVVQVEVAGMDAHDERHWSQQHVGHLQRTQWDVGTEPAQGETNLERERERQRLLHVSYRHVMQCANISPLTHFSCLDTTSGDITAVFVLHTIQTADCCIYMSPLLRC